ncbi:MAG: DNA translocase FtsK, partial [Hyphomicrobiales bacterium]|nr:DNA translocase FtsK [Hyphomicrobiales bacterium]
MSLTGNSAQRKRLLPGAVGVGARRLLQHVLGGALFMVAIACWISLATWSIHDPSFNNATRGAPSNMLSHWGASLADMAFQSFGLGAIALFLPIAAWGWHVMAGQPPGRTRARLIAWPFGVFMVAGGLSALPEPKSWALPNGLGGIMGDLAMTIISVFSYILPSLVTTLVGGVVLFGAGVSGLLFACGIAPAALADIWRGDEDQDEAREARTDISNRADDAADDTEPDTLSLRLGALAHWMMNIPAIAARLLRRSRSGPLAVDGAGESDADAMASGYMRHEPQGSVDQAGRIEPFFNGEAEAAADTAGPGESCNVTPRADTETPKRRVTVKMPGVASTYALPPVRLLKKPPARNRSPGLSDAVLQDNARLLEDVLQDFGVKGEILNVRPGPVVTLYELEPAPGTKSSRVIGLADDIARSMSAAAARVAVVPGRNAIGIELPNARRETVFLRELLEASTFGEADVDLALALGKNIGGESVIVDLSLMPHLLIAGTTGSGKSVGINTMILSLLYRYTPDECKFIMIDPKMLELSVYDGIPHLLAPVVTDPKKAVVALKWTVKEMEERYKRMSKLGVRSIDGYNERVVEAQERGETITRTVQTGFDRETGQAIYEEEEMDYEPMSYIVVIVDEMADLMMVAGKDIEGAVQRLAQMARAAGIHLITATQRPSVDVITGTIKANFPTRVSFQVTSKIDSRTILGEQGAEQLLGQGDMLYMAGGGRITRVHGPFVSDEEVE